MERFSEDELFAELRSLRPAPSAAFAAELDERVAAGFPRRASSSASPLARVADRLRDLAPRRLLVPAAGTALAAVVAATVVVALNEPVGHGGHATRPTGETQMTGAGGPAEVSAPRLRTPATKPSAGAAAGTGSSENFSDGKARYGEEEGAAVAPAVTGPYASRAAHRDVERSTEMVLGAGPGEVGTEATEVFDAVHANRGIVLNSSIRDGAAGEAGAEFDLLIPSAKLGDALAAFSAIGEVRSRHDSSADITAATVGLAERLQDSQAEIEGLLSQLAAADTDAERAATVAALRSERRHAAALRSRLTDRHRRANFSHVSLRIETGSEPSAPGESAGWGIGDALGAAGHILAIAAGVTIVGLAVVGPLALIALIAWLAHRAWLRRRHDRSLG